MEAFVKTEVLKPGLIEITFYHEKANSLPSHILAQLSNAIDEAGSNPEVQVVILKSGGDRTFCGGGSFHELININDYDTGKKFFMGFANVINSLRKCPKLVIGRVQGKAVGGGVGLASSVDYCMATKFASIKLSELNVGIGPFVVGPAVERKIWLSAYSQMTINANQFYTPQWAQSKGLFTEVYETTEELDEEVMKIADYLLSTNPEAQQMLKKVFWEGTDHWDQLLESRAENSGQLVLSDYTKNVLAGYAQS